MLVLKDISKSFGDKVVLDGVNLSLKKGDVASLVGNNGEGKTTLFKIITGEIEYDRGLVESSGESVGYLPQHPNFGDQTIGDFLLSKSPNIREYLLETALSKVGLSQADKGMPCTTLSGGQKTRLYLASLLLVNPYPTVLLLDEPTNNIDLEGFAWLESFIKNFDGIIFLISHDRNFLDKVSTKTVELKGGQIKIYGGNYSFYKEQKKQEEEVTRRLYAVQQKMVKRVEADVSAYKSQATVIEDAASAADIYEKVKAKKTARQGVVHERRLERFLESAEHIEKPKQPRQYKIELAEEVPSGKLILQVQNVSVSFGNKPILKNISFEIRGREHWLVRGPNGSGKTTLLRTINGQIKPDGGEIRFGTSIKVGYFSQEISLNTLHTGLEELKSTSASDIACRNVASRLHLFDQDLSKKVGALSRGQMAKLEFAKILLKGCDLVILDEPTNHLDIETREELEEGLKEFRGAILIASHDQYFTQKLGITNVVNLLPTGFSLENI